MKNMFTKTALASSLVLLGAGVANAQTTVTGNLFMTYKATSTDQSTAAAKVGNSRQFGKEAQINIQNKGKLNNGMDYAAGFSIELDGNDTLAQNATSSRNSSNSLAGAFNENTYIDFISGNTTFSISADHMQNPDYTITNLVGVSDPDDLISGVGANTATLYTPAKNSAYQAYGFGITQKIDNFGNVSLNWTPQRTSGLANNDTNTFNTVNTAGPFGETESAYELGFRGNLGNPNLDLGVFYNRAQNGGVKSAVNGTTGSDIIGKMAAVSYSFGPTKVAFEKAQSTSSSDITIDSDSIGLAYAINKELSIGYTYVRSKSDAVANVNVTTAPNSKEKIQQLSLGYNLGPIAVGVTYGEVKSINGIDGADGKAILTRADIKF